MSHAHHVSKENKKKPQHTLKEKRAMKLEKKRASETSNPEIKVVKGILNPTATA